MSVSVSVSFVSAVVVALSFKVRRADRCLLVVVTLSGILTAKGSLQRFGTV